MPYMPAGFLSGSTGGLIQTASAPLSADVTIASTTFTTILTVTVTTSGSTTLLMRFMGCSSNTTGVVENRFRIQLDGVTAEGGAILMGDGGIGATPGGAESIAINARVINVTAGSHVITLQWAVSGGTGRIRPVAAALQEFGTLVVEEVAI